ncbi:HAD hydrolase family protein [Nostoc commune]|uniref:HAD hydrolase family protein n=1 Tax=Nostoc commune TaxID=1178 RepID=UPI002073FC60|nr:HAD hydrolase family protein [Nostoc commune]
MRTEGKPNLPYRSLPCQARASSGGGEQLSAARSQPYYLDVTHPRANKGAVVARLSQLLGISNQEIATIGEGICRMMCQCFNAVD